MCPALAGLTIGEGVISIFYECVITYKYLSLVKEYCQQISKVKIPYIIVWTGAILQLKSDFLNYYILMNNFFYNLINISLKS